MKACPGVTPTTYPATDFTTLNMVSTTGAFLLGLSTLPFLWNIFRSYRYGEVADIDDPWGYGNSLEWATSSPPPRHNFTALPRSRSERPAFELHHPHMRQRMRAEAHAHSKPPPATPSHLGTRIAGPDEDHPDPSSPGP
jgi:cytochrome c oxidase subunit 1